MSEPYLPLERDGPQESERRARPDTVAVLHWDDERAVAAVLARAFVDDPLVMAICPGPAAERQQRIWWSFRIAVRSHCIAQQPAWTIVNEGTGPVSLVLVIRPRTRLQTPSDFLFALRGLWKMGLGTGLRGSQAAQIIAAHAPPQPFTYLRTLGVDPDWQGCRLGSRLVEWVVQNAPAGFPIYLETAKERNLSFYARHGFTCIGQFECLDIPIWRLIRPAAGVPRLS